MRTLALVAAALTPLLAGCVSSSSMDPGSGSATIYWRFQSFDRLIAGDFTATNPGCLEAGVDEVDLTIRDAGGAIAYYQSHFCQASNGVPGVVVMLLPGRYSFEATAYRGRNHNTADPVFSSAGGFDVGNGLDTPVDTILDVLSPQPLQVLYSKNGAVTCSGVSGVHYSVSDAVGLVEAATVGCDPYNELLVRGASVLGTNYTVDYLQLLDTGGFSIYERCLVPVYHNGFPAVIDLPPTSTPTCF
jgi:hypothetical protein